MWKTQGQAPGEVRQQRDEDKVAALQRLQVQWEKQFPGYFGSKQAQVTAHQNTEHRRGRIVRGLGSEKS